MIWKSPTSQGWKEQDWTFTWLMAEPDGSCVAVERKAGRAMDDKALVVRYPNPFTSDAPPEILLRAKEPLFAGWREPNGTLHAGGKRHHHNASGAWKADKLGAKTNVRAGLTRDDGVSFLLVREAFRSQILRVHGKSVAVLFEHEDQFYLHPGLASRGGVVYAATKEGVLACDDAGTRPADLEPSALLLDDRTVLVDESVHEALQGSAPAGLCPALGTYFYAGGKATSRVVDGKLEPIFEASGWTGQSAGTERILWVANGIELVCTDGDAWKCVARAS